MLSEFTSTFKKFDYIFDELGILISDHNLIKNKNTLLYTYPNYTYDSQNIQQQELLFDTAKNSTKSLVIGGYLGHSILIQLLANPKLNIFNIICEYPQDGNIKYTVENDVVAISSVARNFNNLLYLMNPTGKMENIPSILNDFDNNGKFDFNMMVIDGIYDESIYDSIAKLIYKYGNICTFYFTNYNEIKDKLMKCLDKYSNVNTSINLTTSGVSDNNTCATVKITRINNSGENSENNNLPVKTEPIPTIEQLTVEVDDFMKKNTVNSVILQKKSPYDENPNKVSICLNMIVKNESKVITRLFDSLLGIIDSYFICDTGSTDNTIQLIKDYFNEKGIPGEVIQEPFKNFGYNRTYSLTKARESSIAKATYYLLLDADMTLVVNPNFNKQGLKHKAYSILQFAGNIAYPNLRIVHQTIETKCVGVTHEYYDIPGADQAIMNENELKIVDIGDGGAKGDKFERDARLLHAGLEDPNTSGGLIHRYHFYLANTYFCMGKNEDAIKWYRERVNDGGWIDEVWYSLYHMGSSYMALGKPEMAIDAWLEAYQRHPKRAENIYEITKHYREKGWNNLAYQFYKIGKEIPMPGPDALFLTRSIYQCELDYELSIIGYYIAGLKGQDKLVTNLLTNAPHHKSNLMSNMKFYVDHIATNSAYSPIVKDFSSNDRIFPGVVISTDNKFKLYPSNSTDRYLKFISSTPSITKLPSIISSKYTNYNYLMNIRYVTYKINRDNGSYSIDGKITTANQLVFMDNNLDSKLVVNMSPDINKEPDSMYLGIEDVKLHINNFEPSKVHFMGTCQNQVNKKLGIAYGTFDINKLIGDNVENGFKSIGEISTNPDEVCKYKINYLDYGYVLSPRGRGCEKNWSMFEIVDMNSMGVVYEWSPLTIGRIIPNITYNSNSTNEDNKIYKYKLELIGEQKTPAIFNDIRGSTNGCLYKDEIWFLCHIVDHGSPRIYYHIFVVMSKNLDRLRWSKMFKFEDQKIEFCTGLVIDEDNIKISYSTFDCTSKVVSVSRKIVEKEFML